MDFKVRCIKSDDNDFTVGKVYETKSGEFFGNGKRNYSNWCDPQIEKGRGQTFESLSKWFAPGVQFELVSDKPRLCEILGVEVGEKFNIKDSECSNYQILNENACCCTGATSSGIWYDVIRAINHPEKIIRQPQFSEDEKALLRGLVVAKFPWIARDENNAPCAYERRPTKRSNGKWDSDYEYDDKIIPTEMLKQITWNDSKPFNAVEYLEGVEMSKDEIIARQAEKIIELEDKLAEANEMKNSFFNQWQESVKNSIPVKPLTMEDTVPALAHMEVPSELH